MSLDYKKLLSKNLRNTRWGEYIDAFQNIIDTEIKPEKIDIIKNQFIIEFMTKDEILDFAYMFGFNLSTYNGYTQTIEYLKREVITIVPRIKEKTNRKCYKYIFYIFNLSGDIFPLLRDEYDETYLTVLEDWWTQEETFPYIQTLDSDADILLYRIPKKLGLGIKKLDDGFNLDTYMDIYDNPKETNLPPAQLDDPDPFVFPHLDMYSYLDRITRHLLISYEHKFIESTTEFMSEESNLAFFNDVKQAKRKIEVPYFEVILAIDTNKNKTLTTKTFIDYEQTISADMKSILIGADVTTVETIHFGDGSHSTIDLTITGVSNEIVSKNISDFEIIENANDNLYIRKKLFAGNTFYDFSEIALKDNGGNCLYYATFPKIIWHEYMYSNIYIKISLII